MFNFGQTQQTQQPAFAANNTGFGFGTQQQQTPAFGQQQPATSIFGQPAATPAFGASTPAFGAGGFGSAARPAQGIFGASSAATPAFGSTSAFGAPQQQPTGIFGQTQQQQSTFRPSTGLFGQPATPAPFGSTATSAPFGAATSSTSTWSQSQDAGSNGTGNPSFRTTPEAQEPGQIGRLPQNHMQSITAMPEYLKYSFEELRCRDYELGKKFSTSGGSAFGSTAFGAPATSTFGSATTQSAPFSGFGAKPATTSAFGSTSFGQPAATPAFGGFGTATTQPSVFGQPAQSTATTSAFGAPAPSGFGGFGTTAATPGLFGKPATTTAAPVFGGFGATTQSTTPAFGGFGTATSTAAPAFGGFGAAATTQPSLFGASQPATTGAFGGFGQSSAFGAKTTTTPFAGFGTTTTTQPATGFGTGLGAGFGAQPATGLGGFGTPATTAATGGLFSGLGTGFGQQTTQPATGFGFSQPARPAGGFSFAPTTSASTSLFGGQSTIGSAPLFQQSTNTFGSSLAPQNPLQASIDKQPYGNNPLFNLPPLQPQRPPQQQQQSAQEQPGIIPVTTPKKPALTPMYKLTPRTTSKVKLRGFTPAKSPSGHLFDGTSKDDAVLGFSPTSQFVPRRNIKQLDLDADEESDKGKEKADGNSSGYTAINQNSKTNRTFDADKEEVVQGLETPSKPTQPSKTASKPPQPQSESPVKQVQSQKVVGRIGDYEMSPSLDQLNEMSDDELRRVKNFTISLKGIGSIRFLKPVNLLEAAPSRDRKTLHMIPGYVVVIKSKMVEVYPEDTFEDVPSVGHGMNCPAEITLNDCWAIDSATREFITDPHDPRSEQRVEVMRNREGTEFVGFNWKTGEWKFRVKHF